MNVPNAFTLTRILLAPVFFILCFLPEWTSVSIHVAFPLLVIVYIYIEASDLADGYIARRHNLVTEMGKILDPFSDVICRLSYFLAFTLMGIMPPVSLLIILYREFGAAFLRAVLSQRGISLAARVSGKIKGLLYSFATMLALFVLYFQWFTPPQSSLHALLTASRIFFWGIALFSSLSFVDYLIASRKHLLIEKK